MSDFLNNFLDEKDFGNRKPQNTSKKSGNGGSPPAVANDGAIRVMFKPKGAPPEEIIVPKFRKTPSNLVGKSTILYGPSGSGKSLIIRDFMYTVKNCFPMVFAFAPTNSEKHDYDAILPKPMVYEEFDNSDIREQYLRQKSTTDIYNRANNLKVLKSLFKRVSNSKAERYVAQLERTKEKILRSVDEHYPNMSERKEKIKEIEKMYTEKLRQFYKKIIAPQSEKLWQMDLDKEEKYALRYIYLNPKILAIFDDAYTEIKKLIKDGKKKNEEFIKDFFFKGRHINETLWFAFQDDSNIDSDIRKNAFNNIFTDKQVALAWFGRAANNFSSLEKKRAEAVINVVFDETVSPKHAKLVYMRLEKFKFQYIVADEHEDEDIRMCAGAARKVCKKAQSREEGPDTNNPYYEKFSRGIE